MLPTREGLNQKAVRSLQSCCESEMAKCETTAASTADEIVKMANAVRVYAEALSNKAYRKLAPVMGYELPCPTKEDQLMREYPPLFADLRDQFESIRMHLEQIDDALTRTEL